MKDAEPKYSETELEDAMHFVENLELKGSLKQINWAKSILLDNLDVVLDRQKAGKQISTEASEWINWQTKFRYVLDD